MHEKVRQRDTVRFLLGFAQMFVATFAGVVVLYSGLNRISLTAVLVASLLTMLSLLLFRK